MPHGDTSRQKILKYQQKAEFRTILDAEFAINDFKELHSANRPMGTVGTLLSLK